MLAAQRAHVTDDHADLIACRTLAVRGHIERQAKGRPATRDDPDPTVFRLRRGCGARRKIGRRHVEFGCRRGRAAGIGAMAVTAPCRIETVSLRAEARCPQRGAGDEPQYSRHGGSPWYRRF